MKTNKRLDYELLTQALIERGVGDPSALQAVLTQCIDTGALLPGILVDENIVSDWELTRVVCEVFNLSYLPVDHYAPSEEAREDIDEDFLRTYGLVPLDRWADVLTVAMPGIVPADVLQTLGRQTGTQVIPVVGSVNGNKRWLRDVLPSAAEVEAPEAPLPSNVGGDWEHLFDQAEAAIQLDLQGDEE